MGKYEKRMEDKILWQSFRMTVPDWRCGLNEKAETENFRF